MARWQGQKPSTREEWLEAGKEAILDLLAVRWVVPWTEVEARIAHSGWNSFPPVQPLQLTSARRALIDEGAIISETTSHALPVATIRLPFPAGRTRELTRLRGSRRKGYRKYLSWAEDYSLCGRQCERNIILSAQAAASEAGLWVPPQTPGQTTTVGTTTVTPGPLDALVHVLDPATITARTALVFEAKNIHRWVYPWTKELWELLHKAALLAQSEQVVPVLVCVRASYSTWQMAQDLGFFLIQLTRQVFSPQIDPLEFDTVKEEFGLVMERFEGEDEHVVSFLTKTLRRNPPLSPPNDEDVPWFERQMYRFAVQAPAILRFDSLAGELPDDRRSSVFAAFRAASTQATMWPLLRGW